MGSTTSIGVTKAASGVPGLKRLTPRVSANPTPFVSSGLRSVFTWPMIWFELPFLSDGKTLPPSVNSKRSSAPPKLCAGRNQNSVCLTPRWPFT